MKILVIRLSSLGDIILTFPVIKNIKLNFPDCEVWYLTKKNFAPILNTHPDIDKVIEFKNLKTTLKELSSENFDFIFDLHSNLRSIILTSFLKAGKKVRYKKDSLWRYILIRFKYISPRLERHVVDKYLQTLKDVNLKIFTKELSVKNIRININQHKSDIKKIIIFQTAFLGDLLLTLPIIEKIKKNNPSSFISLVVREENVKALENIKEIDLIIVDRKKTNKISSFIDVVKKIRRIGFDTAIIPHRSLRTAIICWLGGVKERIGFDIKPSSFFYTKKVPFKWSIHDVERNMMLVDCITDISDITFPKIETQTSIFSQINSPVIVINPFSVWETKRWPEYKFAALIRRLNENYKTKPIIIGSSKEREQSERLLRLVPDDSVINLCGKTDLNQLIEVIKKADLLITNDSGPMHIASAVGTYVIAIFGPTTKELGFFPYSDKSKVVEVDLKCRPCRLHGSKKCPKQHFLCMKLVSVDMVLKEIEKFLKYKL